MHMNEPLLDLQEVARLLYFSRSAIYKLIRSGRLPAVRIGGRLRVQREDLQLFLEASALRSPPPAK